MGIITSKLYDPDLEYLHLRDDRLVLIGNAESDIDKISIKDLEDIPMILREADSNITKVLMKGLGHFDSSYGDMNLVMTAGSSELVMSAVRAGTGFGFYQK